MYHQNETKHKVKQVIFAAPRVSPGRDYVSYVNLKFEFSLMQYHCHCKTQEVANTR